MSGIAGIIHFDGKPVEPGLIEKMTSAMAHRGPDGINHWVKGSVALGQCMLRTTPESLEEHQPLTNEDESLVLVMDGRVDNWEELRRELLGRGAVLRNRSDAELVLRAYEIWGRDCLAHIDGDFALVIWDARRQEAFCARDRMGHKPFNYHWDGKTLAFASELHAILALPWVPEIPNEGMLAEFLAAEWYSRDETLWQGILRLVAAHRMVVDATGPRLEAVLDPGSLGNAAVHERRRVYRPLPGTGVRRRQAAISIASTRCDRGQRRPGFIRRILRGGAICADPIVCPRLGSRVTRWRSRMTAKPTSLPTPERLVSISVSGFMRFPLGIAAHMVCGTRPRQPGVSRFSKRVHVRSAPPDDLVTG